MREEDQPPSFGSFLVVGRPEHGCADVYLLGLLVVRVHQGGDVVVSGRFSAEHAPAIALWACALSQHVARRPGDA